MLKIKRDTDISHRWKKKWLCKKMRKEGRGILSLAEYGPKICLNPCADTL